MALKTEAVEARIKPGFMFSSQSMLGMSWEILYLRGENARVRQTKTPHRCETVPVARLVEALNR